MQGLQPKGGSFQSGEKEDGKGSLTFFRGQFLKNENFLKCLLIQKDDFQQLFLLVIKKINRFKKGRLTNADDLYFQLLTSLMPRAIIKQLKRGMVPKPEIFDNTTVFFSDIVSFTQVSGILLS